MNPDVLSELERMLYIGHADDVCPYLGDRDSRLRYIDGRLAPRLYREMLDHNYRRYGNILYRPDCPGCNECRMIRVPVAEFRPSKSQRRILNRCKPVFRVEFEAPSYSREKLDLYRDYLAVKHGSGDVRFDRKRYEEFFVSSCLGNDTFELQLIAGAHLAGVGIIDRLPEVLSSMYFFFDPDYAAYSPGVYSSLVEIELSKQWKLDYYYLGYYIAESPTMKYKKNYRPCEILDSNAGDWEVIR